MLLFDPPEIRESLVFRCFQEDEREHWDELNDKHFSTLCTEIWNFSVRSNLTTFHYYSQFTEQVLPCKNQFKYGARQVIRYVVGKSLHNGLD